MRQLALLSAMRLLLLSSLLAALSLPDAAGRFCHIPTGDTNCAPCSCSLVINNAGALKRVGFSDVTSQDMLGLFVTNAIGEHILRVCFCV